MAKHAKHKMFKGFEAKEEVFNANAFSKPAEKAEGVHYQGAETDDRVAGTKGADILGGAYGDDTVRAGRGDDTLISRSDEGEPIIAQSPELARITGEDQPSGNDVLSGGRGADLFKFQLLLNAKAEIIAQHLNEDGTVDWHGVAGENNAAHDHWLESIGDDIIKDFDAAQGDKIVIEGHTVEAKFSWVDTNGDGKDDSTIINLNSQQGDGGGAHDEDRTGTITVLNSLLDETDVTVDAGVHYGMDSFTGSNHWH